MTILHKILLGSVAGFALVGAAQAADLPTKKTPPAPAATNCFASAWDWLNSTAADCPLSYMGVTVYGTIDVGAGYETHASAFNRYYAQGVSETVAKSGNGARWQWVPNGLSQSNVGIKIKEQIVPDWFLIGDVNTGFDPYSFELANGPKSLVQNNGAPTLQWSANGDSSRAGQWDNTRAYAGLSNKTFGTLTAGRQYTFSNDLASAYDPTGGSYAFSLIGNSSTPVGGLGVTEVARYNTSVKYQVTYSAFRAGALWQFGDYSDGNGSNGAYQFDLGADYAGFSLDAIYGHANDAVILSSLSAATILAHPTYADDLKASIANVDSAVVAGKYKNGPWQLFAGYAYDRLSNPSDSYAVDRAIHGFDSIAGIDVPGGNTIAGNVNIYAYSNNKTLQTAWGGVKYALRSDIDVAGGYYYEWQNNYGGYNTTAAGAKGTTYTATAAGNLQAVTALIDWRPVKRIDVYGGVMYSKVNSGMAAGYTHTDNTAFTAGLRFSF